VKGRSIDGMHNAVYGPPYELLKAIITPLIHEYKSNRRSFELFFTSI